MTPTKVISGGQTGADRAALDWALRRGVPHGGWCPAGRLAEDGVIPPKYSLMETPSGDYAQRTEWNVRDSDGTVILTLSPALSGGSLLTFQSATQLGKPCLHAHQGMPLPRAAQQVRAFVEQHRARVLNIAGPRASLEPGIAQFVLAVLDEAFGGQRQSDV